MRYYIQSFTALLLFIVLCLQSSGQHPIKKINRLLVTTDDSLIYIYKPVKGEGFRFAVTVSETASRPDKTLIMNNNDEGWPGEHVSTTRQDSVVFTSKKPQ